MVLPCHTLQVGPAESLERFCICNDQDHSNCILANAYVSDSIQSVTEPLPVCDNR